MRKAWVEESHPSYATTTGQRRVLRPTPNCRGCNALRPQDPRRPQVTARTLPSTCASQTLGLQLSWASSRPLFSPSCPAHTTQLWHGQHSLLTSANYCPGLRPDSLPSLPLQNPHSPLFRIQGTSPGVRVFLRTSQVSQT